MSLPRHTIPFRLDELHEEEPSLFMRIAGESRPLIGECDCGRKDQPLVMLITMFGGRLVERPHCPICEQLWVEQNQQ